MFGKAARACLRGADPGAEEHRAGEERFVLADELDRELRADGMPHQKHLSHAQRTDPLRKRVRGCLRLINLRRGLARAGQMRHQHMKAPGEHVILMRKGIQRRRAVQQDQRWVFASP